MKKLSASLFNTRNSIILGIVIISSAVLYTYDITLLYPVVFGSLFIFFSTLYSIMFESPSNEVQNNTSLKNLANQVSDNISSIVEKITISLNNIKESSEGKFAIIGEFTDDICSFEEMIPRLVKSYRKGAVFLKERKSQLNLEINQLEVKLNNASANAKETYKKALEERKNTFNEMEEIKNNLEECESKLYYILSTLEKIETIMQSVELKDGITDDDTSNIAQQLEVFSGSIKDVVNLMKL